MLEGGNEKWTGRWWMICRSGAGHVEAMALPCGGEEALALFSHEEEAELFLRSLAFDGLENGWYIREGRSGEVASVLYDPCANAKRVALAPVPIMASEGTAALVSLDRFDFMADLLARDEARTRPSHRECGNASGPQRASERRLCASPWNQGGARIEVCREGDRGLRGREDL